MSKKKQENPKITKNFEYTDGRYQIKGTLWQHYILMNLIGKYNCQFWDLTHLKSMTLFTFYKQLRNTKRKECEMKLKPCTKKNSNR